jgi:prepilin-type N-terminal cleavage/methylation domain-containing protein
MDKYNRGKKMHRLRKKEKGFALIEVLLALGILAIVGTTFLIGIGVSSKAILVANERTTAESLARSQMEWVKELLYVDEASGYGLGPGLAAAGYTISTAAFPLNTPDDGIQRIVVTVKRSGVGEGIIILEDYKVKR